MTLKRMILDFSLSQDQVSDPKREAKHSEQQFQQEHAISIFKELGQSAGNKMYRVICLFQLGKIYQAKKQHEEAIWAFEEALNNFSFSLKEALEKEINIPEWKDRADCQRRLSQSRCNRDKKERPADDEVG